MAPFQNPIVIVTRPRAASLAFLDLLSASDREFQAVVAPAFEIEPVEAKLPQFDVAILTSVAGVSHAPAGQGRRAYCVGPKTSAAAQAKGYTVVNADGSADDLVDVILDSKEKGRLLHLRGESSAGNITARLQKSGISVAEAVVYRKAPCPVAPQVQEIELASQPVILPLFSAETVSILADWNLQFGRLATVSISASVDEKTRVFGPALSVVCNRPNQTEMVSQTLSLIA